jgi:membrane protein
MPVPEPQENSTPSLWSLGGLKPAELARRVWRAYNQDNVAGHAAQLSYYFLMALFPALLLLLTIAGFVAQGNPHFRAGVFLLLGSALPPSASELVDKTVTDVARAAGGLKLTFGVVFTLWSASGGIQAIMQTLNRCFGVTETRPWWKRAVTAVGLTIALAVLVQVAMALVLFGPHIARWLGARLELSNAFVLAWRAVQYPVALGLMLTAFGLLYHLAPDRKKSRWQWITPGSVAGVCLWVVASFGFRLYLHYFNSYAKTYGSLGAVITLMIWLYATGIAILLGGEVNATIENAAAEQSRADGRAAAAAL